MLFLKTKKNQLFSICSWESTYVRADFSYIFDCRQLIPLTLTLFRGKLYIEKELFAFWGI